MAGKDDDHAGRRLWILAGVIAALLVLAAAWRWTPLNEYLAPERLVGLMAGFDNAVTRVLAAVAAFLLASLLMVPLTLLAVIVGVALGGLLGFVCAITASVLSAAIGFWIGRTLSRDAVQRLAGDRLRRINALLAHRGVVPVALARLVPAAPFTVFNLVAGASHLRFRPYIIGSFLALTPGLAALTLFSDSLRNAFANPSPRTIAIVAGIGLIILLVLFIVRRRLRA